MTTRLCRRCDKVKGIECFYKKGKGLRGLHSVCKPCFNLRDRQTGLMKLLRNARSHAKKSNITFGLTLGYLRKVLHLQGGVCALSGLEFSDNVVVRSAFARSLDRIDSSKGYCEGNVRVVLWYLNKAIAEYGLEMYLEMARRVLSYTNQDSPPQGPLTTAE